MKCIYCLLLLLCPYVSGAQAVRPGHAVEGLALQLYNYALPHSDLAAFKGKYVLLDFWATWCSNCIKKFGLLDSVQRAHTSSLAIVLVNTASTGDSPAKIAAFYKRYRNPEGLPLSLPTAVQDTAANRMFPHDQLPHYVWIDTAGICVAITGPDEVSASRLEAFATGMPVAFAGLDLMQTFKPKEPLFIDDNGGNGSQIFYRSTFFRYIPGLLSGAYYNRNARGLITRYAMINIPLTELIKRAYNVEVPAHSIVVTESVQAMFGGGASSTAQDNRLGYEVMHSGLTSAALCLQMQRDIAQSLGIAACWQERQVPVFCISADSCSMNNLKTKGGKYRNKLADPDSSYLQNGTLEQLARYLHTVLPAPVVCDSPGAFNIDITLEAGVMPSAQSLAKKGLLLSSRMGTVKQFVIYQLPKQLP